MAKKKADTGNRSAYWRKVFSANRELLRDRSNDALRGRFRSDHGRDMDSKDVQALTNVKADLRKRYGIRAKGKRRKKAAAAAAPANAAAPRAKVSAANLERLEIAIDNCLMMARGFDPEGLEKAVKFLRAARNAVVWQLGE